MIDAAILLAGPRGRRLLLEFALASERIMQPDYSKFRLLPAVSSAGYELDPGRGSSRVMAVIGEGEPNCKPASPHDVSVAMDLVPLAEVTSELLCRSLATAVDTARYWQEPEGEDYLVATPEMRPALARVAGHIAASPHAQWWQTRVDLGDQWSVRFPVKDEFQQVPEREDLQQWRQSEIESEEHAIRNRPTDPTANWSGRWWSIPPTTYQHSLRSLHDATPAALVFAEDAGGFDGALTQELYPPADARIYEIDGPEAWADLCRLFPLEQTAQKRQDWYRTTGRVGRWIIPDWSLVAREYDGIHLTVIGYLSAAGTAIQVDDDSASVIAGWNPDETWWLGDELDTGETKYWRYRNTFSGNYWEPEKQAEG